jgi:hypothetical protein
MPLLNDFRAGPRDRPFFHPVIQLLSRLAAIATITQAMSASSTRQAAGRANTGASSRAPNPSP